MMKASVFFVLLASAAATQPAWANYPCGGGPGPGERQIGTMGGSNGIAVIPICTSDGSPEGPEAAPRGTGVLLDPPPELMNLYQAITGETLEYSMAKQELDREQQKMEADPEYQRFRQGEWKIFQGKAHSAPGDNCIAMWSKEGGLVSIVGPGTAYQGGMLIFWSAEAPKPSSTQTVTVTLKQSQYQPQTVKALNFSVPHIPFGAIGLTVPTIDAALQTMLDVEHFELEMEGRKIAQVSWTGGLAARDQLRQCVNNRSN
ncbi:hypothetical protein [Pseudomonas sp. F(2018)]|uniref:hypothetical protein n=1 Tax=Pseudomonas sp. F(2018) TaxID=2502240 RepID=UPI0010F513FA|nr:hypothetical protein [Pseudomonas sp. F(2018)]